MSKMSTKQGNVTRQALAVDELSIVTEGTKLLTKSQTSKIPLTWPNFHGQEFQQVCIFHLNLNMEERNKGIKNKVLSVP